mmetsp:Transcript_11194/g.25481  ORF Transcript_11194/g.25481 Transcript_11194/m.25481 type:complete len:952 (+) Transcript_11194:69-2924(+)
MSTAAPKGNQPGERRGFLVNEYTNNREFFVLRSGVLRILQSPKGPDIGAVYLSPGSSITLISGNVLEIHSRLPYVAEYILRANSEDDAEGWHDAVKAHIVSEQAKADRLQGLLENGCTMNKYNYSNSKRSRRYFWVEGDGQDLCWGRSKGEDTQKVNLKECMGIIYGPLTTTFQRCPQIEDPSWSCFSLLFMGRTLDLAVAGDLQVHAWFLGMQHLISVHGIGSMPIMSDAQFNARKVQLKLTDAAHRQGLVLSRFLINQCKALGTGSGKTGLGSGALVSGGTAKWKGDAGAAAVVSALQSGVKAKKEKKKGNESPLEDPEVKKLQERVLELQSAIRGKAVQTEAATAVMKNPQLRVSEETGTQAVEAALAGHISKALASRSGKLQVEAQNLSDAVEQMAPQVKEAKTVAKSLQKIQVKLEETEARRSSLNKDLASLQANTEVFSGARATSSTAEAAAKSKGQDLQRKIQELEQKLSGAQHGQHAEVGAAQEKAMDAQVAAAEQARLEHEQKLESLQRDIAKARDREAKAREKLAKLQATKKKLQGAAKPLAQLVVKLREEQKRLKTELVSAQKRFNEDMKKVTDAVSDYGTRCNELSQRYRAAQEDRKKLHNQVLDLKGNIRVFVRVRPINEKEIHGEPEGEATCTFPDDMRIGVYDGQNSRRKIFDFDQCFHPKSTQEMVFAEACPLATSVLDGYNVCIFAYGQTGSGKTHTMGGAPNDPGLNTRVLRELFRIRGERRGEYDVNLSISITEIYNENIRDLLSPSAKKLDVKQNADGTCGVPGLEERKVEKVADVLQAMDDAQKSRSTSSTDMNEQSSRSHSIVTVRTQCSVKGGETYVGKVHLIDLAGSEDVGRSGVAGQGLKEAQNINRSLSALGDVISSLVSKSSHTPYRNSKLTMMLKDSLGGDSKTLMIVCCSPAQDNVRETMSSLNFAARARNVELGKANRHTK